MSTVLSPLSMLSDSNGPGPPHRLSLDDDEDYDDRDGQHGDQDDGEDHGHHDDTHGDGPWPWQAANRAQSAPAESMSVITSPCRAHHSHNHHDHNHHEHHHHPHTGSPRDDDTCDARGYEDDHES